MASRGLPPAIALLVVAGLGGLVGCGGGGGGAAEPPRPATAAVPTEPPSTEPPPVTTQAATAAPSTTETSPEDRQGGAGDEEAIRVPAVFTFRRAGVDPPTVAVPAFLTIELRGVSKDGRAHELNFRGTVVRVPADGSASARIEGLRAGRYEVGIDGRPNAASIVSGAEPGP